LTEKNTTEARTGDAGSGKPAERRLPTILTLCGVLLLFVLLLVAAQNLLGGLLSGGYWVIVVPAVVSLAFFAGGLLAGGKTARAVSSVNMAVAVLVLIAVGCILGTLTLQERDLGPGVSEEAYYGQFKWAEAGFFYRVLHPFGVVRVKLEAPWERYYQLLAERFGRDYARKQRRSEMRHLKNHFREREIELFARRHDKFFKGLFRLCKSLRLTDAYRSWWFIFLVSSLSFNLALCASKRLGLSLSRVGFQMTHLGVIILLIGAALGTCLEQKGMLAFYLGQHDSFDSFEDMSRGGEEVLFGFTVKLTGFRTEYRKKLRVEFLDIDREGLPPGCSFARLYGVWPGAKIKLKGGKVVLRVEEFMPATTVETQIVNREDQPENPVVELEMKGEEETKPVTLVARDEARSVALGPGNRFKVKLVWQTGPGVLQRELQAAARPKLGVLRLKCPGDKEPTEVVLTKKGQEIVRGDIKLKVLEICGNFARRGSPLEEQLPSNPAVQVRIERPTGSEERWYFARPAVQRFYLQFHPIERDDIEVEFEYPTWESPCRWRYLLVADSSGGLSVFSISGAKAEGPSPVRVGSPLAASGPGANVIVTKYFRHAALQHDIVEYKPPEGVDPEDAYFDDPSQPAIKLRVTTPDSDESVWMVANSQKSEHLIPGLLKLTYEDVTGSAKDWKSRLQVLEENRVVKTEVIEVNHPMSYKGYKFYQTDANPKIPTYSGIKVVRDPGWPVALVGMIVVLAGILYNFYVRPFLTKGANDG